MVLPGQSPRVCSVTHLEDFFVVPSVMHLNKELICVPVFLKSYWPDSLVLADPFFKTQLTYSPNLLSFPPLMEIKYLPLPLSQRLH